MSKTKIISFWIKFWCKDRSEYHEMYEYYGTDWLFIEKDKNDVERWLDEAKCFGESVYMGIETDYKYGYENVKNPPKEWLKKKLQKAIDDTEFYDFWLTMYNIENEGK